MMKTFPVVLSTILRCLYVLLPVVFFFALFKIVEGQLKSSHAVALQAKGNNSLSEYGFRMIDYSPNQASRERLPSAHVVSDISVSFFSSDVWLFGILCSISCLYVVKNDGGKEVIKALESVMQDKKYYSEAVAQAIMEKYRQQKKEVLQARKIVIEVTNRERQVMEYISKGYTNHRIAEELFISFRTVETHRANLMRKLEARNSVELVNKAREHSLVA